MERARRTGTKKQSREAVRAALRAAREGGAARSDQWEAKEEKDVYEQVTEQEYADLVRKRRQIEDFVVDDDGLGYDLGVPRCCGAFTPSTRVVSRRGGRGWSLFLILRLFGPFPVNTMLRAGLNRRQLTDQDKDEIRAVLLKMNCIPVFSSNSEEGYLNYCKRILWPSFHNVTVLDQCCAAWHERAEWDQDAGSSWSAYEAMNGDFRDMLLDFLRAGDTVWVHVRDAASS